MIAVDLFLIELFLALAALAVAIAGLALTLHFIGWLNTKFDTFVGWLVFTALMLGVVTLVFLI